MSQHFGCRLSAVVNLAARYVWPEGRAKSIADALGVSVDTGKKLSAGYHVSERLNRAYHRLLDHEIGRAQKRLSELRHRLHEETGHDQAVDQAVGGVPASPAPSERRPP